MRNSLRIIAAASAVFLACGALAAPKDSVTIGMVLEPPGLDPTTRAGRGHRRDRALQHLRRPDQDQRATSR